jgi:hypothetical protein
MRIKVRKRMICSVKLRFKIIKMPAKRFNEQTNIEVKLIMKERMGKNFMAVRVRDITK